MTEEEEYKGNPEEVRKGKETGELTWIRNEGAVRSEAQGKELWEKKTLVERYNCCYYWRYYF